MKWSLLALGCLFFSTAQAATGHSIDEIETYREDSRLIMRRARCGSCHIPPGISEALKIYNLDHENWTSSMSDNQVGQIKWRIEWTNDEVAKIPAQSKKWLLSKSDIKVLHDYVDHELAYRKVKREAANAASKWLDSLGNHQ